MTIDLTAFPPEVRKRLIRTGKGFSLDDVMSQAEQALTAFATHGPVLEDFGFIAADAQELGAAFQQLGDAGVERGEARGGQHVASSGYVAAFKEAKKARLRGRSITLAVMRALERSGQKEAASKVRGILRQTTVASDSAAGMAGQLELLSSVLLDEQIAPAAAARKGAETAALLAQRAADLRQASQGRAGRGGTPMHTQDIHQLKGIIVDHVREARRSAMAAAEELGNPVLASAFKLDRLYRSYSRPGDLDLPEEHDGEVDDDIDDDDDDNEDIDTDIGINPAPTPPCQ